MDSTTSSRSARRALRGAVLTAAAGVTALAFASPAAAARDFSLRFDDNEPGAIAITGSTLMTCPDDDDRCADARAGLTTGTAANNNDYVMRRVDVDDSDTFTSSRAGLELPAGSEVLFAGLYWGADRTAGTDGKAAPDSSAANAVRLRAPGAAGYTKVTASQHDLIGERYQGFAEVTDVVSAAGSGEYTVADVQSGTGKDRHAGWSLVVAYRDTAAPVRNLSIFDGFHTVSSRQPNVDVKVDGFRTPKVGAVRSEVGFVAYEGDLGSTGDGAKLNDTDLTDTLKPADNVFNSAIGRAGERIAVKDPDYVNQMGFDAFTTRADGILPNDATSATIHLTTGGETYFPGAVTFATELYAPRVRPEKVVADVNGGVVEPGDELEYTITVPNDGQDGAEKVAVTDPIPDHTSYVPDSAEVVGGPGHASFAGETVTFHVGTGASAAAGGRLAPGERAVVRFRVRVDDPVPAGTAVLNQASAEFESQTLGLPLEAESNEARATVETPNLTIAKTHHGIPAAGQDTTYALTVTNEGGARSSGAVTVTDELDPRLTLRSAGGDGWSCSQAQTVICTREDRLAANASHPPIEIVVAVAPGATGNLSNTGRVTGGGDGDSADNSATDSVQLPDPDVTTPVDEPTPPPTQTEQPPVTPPAQATPAAGACPADYLRLVEVRAAGRRVVLAGEAAAAKTGSDVTLLFAGRELTTARVQADGTFRTTVPLPPRELRATSRARYTAVLGDLRSPAMKLTRRMQITRIANRAGRVTIAGRITQPLALPVRTVTLREYADCLGRELRVVRRGIRVSPSGRFRVTVPAPASGVAYYRALTQVRTSTRSSSIFPTFTLLRGVRLGR
jgi:uncharacterized repeat protein (TIGR01451 family)